MRILKISLAEFQLALRSVLRGGTASLRLRKKQAGANVFFLGEGAWQLGSHPDPLREVPFSAYAVLTGRRLPELAKVTAGQTMIELVVSTMRPESLETILHDNTNSPLDQVKLIGPGLVTLEKSKFSTGERRDARLLSRIKDVQAETRDAWRGSCHVVVGAGSGGSSLAMQLAAQAPGSMILIDPDRLKAHNLINLPAASSADAQLQRLKVNVLAHLLHANSPDLLVTAIPSRVQELQIQDYLQARDPTAIWSFVDDPAAHLACAYFSRGQLVPHIAIGTSVTKSADGRVQHQCDVRLLVPRAGCARCVPMLARDEYQELMYELRRPRGCLRRGGKRRWNENNRLGSSLSTNQMACALAVGLFNRLLQGLVTTSVWLRLLTGPRGEPQLIESTVGRHKDCLNCR